MAHLCQCECLRELNATLPIGIELPRRERFESTRIALSLYDRSERARALIALIKACAIINAPAHYAALPKLHADIGA